MRLEIGAGAAAGRAGGVLWSSAILAAISPLRAAFTSRLSGARPLRCARPVPAASRHSRLHSFPPLAFFAAFWSVPARVWPSVPLSPSPPCLWVASASLRLWLLLISSGLVLIPSGSPSVCLSLSGCPSLLHVLSAALPSVSVCFSPCFCL